MTSKEYVIWLKGFVEACHEYAPTPKQWDALKDTLAEVNDLVGTPIGPGLGVPNTHPFPTWQEPHRTINPYYIGDNPVINQPFISTIPNGTGGSSGVITTTPGSGSITISNPPFGFGITSTPGYGTLTYDPSTTTRWNPSGSNWSYTTNKPHNED